MLLRVWMHGEKHWTAQRQLETLYHTWGSLTISRFPIRVLLCITTLLCKEVGLGELSPCSKLSKGPCMDLSLHVPNSYLRVACQLTSNLRTNRSHLPWIRIYTAYVLESSLSRGLFLWMVQHKSRFAARIWHSAKVCVWLVLQVWKFQELSTGAFRYCQMSVNNCSCSRINFGQTAVEGILDPLQWLSFSTGASLKHLMDLNIAWACFRACFPGTDTLAPASSTSEVAHMDEPHIDFVLHGFDSRWYNFAHLEMP